MSLRRINAELRDIQECPSQNFSLGPKGDDLFQWSGCIIGPEGSPYHNGVYALEMTFPRDYPFKPPRVKLQTKIYHPKINEKGGIHLGILKNDWSPALTAVQICLRIIELLRKPLPYGCCEVNAVAAKLYKNNKKRFCKIASEWNQKFADGDVLDMYSVGIMNMLQPLKMNQYHKCYKVIDELRLFGGNKDLKKILIQYYGKKDEEITCCSDYEKNMKEKRQLFIKQKLKKDYEELRKNKQKSGSEIKLYVKTLTGKTIEVIVHANDIVQEVKFQIYEKEGIPLDQQRLIFSGKQLEELSSLSRYGIQTDHTLHLVLIGRCSGG